MPSIISGLVPDALAVSVLPALHQGNPIADIVSSLIVDGALIGCGPTSCVNFPSDSVGADALTSAIRLSQSPRR